MRMLPVDARGYPVPYFVAWVEGVPDFRISDERKLVRCVQEHRCWLCGQRLGTFLAFVVGPMCAINRISSEPPAHRECAEFAAKACPFLTRPKAKRRDANLPEERRPSAGVMIERNPGVALVWVTKTYRVVRAPRGEQGHGVPFEMGPPRAVVSYTEGRPSTKEEIRESVESGLPLLLAEVNVMDARAVRAFERNVEIGRAVLGIAS